MVITHSMRVNTWLAGDTGAVRRALTRAMPSPGAVLAGCIGSRILRTLRRIDLPMAVLVFLKSLFFSTVSIFPWEILRMRYVHVEKLRDLVLMVGREQRL